MRNVKLVVYGISETFSSEIIKMREIPMVGEHISTVYFQDRYGELKRNKRFRVSRILHHYLDDMSGIDYTDIELERSI